MLKMPRSDRCKKPPQKQNHDVFHEKGRVDSFPSQPRTGPSTNPFVQQHQKRAVKSSPLPSRLPIPICVGLRRCCPLFVSSSLSIPSRVQGKMVARRTDERTNSQSEKTNRSICPLSPPSLGRQLAKANSAFAFRVCFSARDCAHLLDTSCQPSAALVFH